MLSYVLDLIAWSKRIYSPLRVDNAYAYMRYESPKHFRRQEHKRDEYDRML